MTTRLSYTIKAVIDYDSLSFTPDEPEPLPDARYQYPVLGEYWRFDRTRGDFYGEPLAGDRLVNGEYCPVELTTEPDGFLKGYSPALHLSLCC